MTKIAVPSGSSVAGRVVVVVGGTGFVGGFVVQALLRAGARVVVPTRKPQRVTGPAPAEQLGGRLRAVHVRTWEDPHEIGAALADAGWRADAVVASIGGWWRGTELVEISPSAWRDLVESHLTGHFLAARTLAPLIAGEVDPVYLALNGVASREPLALSGPISVTGAAQTMLLDVLRGESVGASVRFHELVVLSAVRGDARNLDPESTVSGADVADAALTVLGDARAARSVEVGG